MQNFLSYKPDRQVDEKYSCLAEFVKSYNWELVLIYKAIPWYNDA